MDIERKFIFTTSELRELLMATWVDGWYHKKDDNDNGKREFSSKTIAKLIDVRN